MAYEEGRGSVAHIFNVETSDTLNYTTMPASFVCPVCRFPDLYEQPVYEDGGVSDEMCPSCGFQFGYDGNSESSFEEWRLDWISRGMPWSSRGIPRPSDWNPEAQLRNLRDNL